MMQDDIIKEDQAGEAGETEQPETGAVPAQDESIEKRIEALTAENQQLRDRLLRLAAEFDNYRKRTDRDMGNLLLNANAQLAAMLLPSLDDLDRILTATESDIDPDALLSGIRLVQKNLVKILQDEGLKPMESVGEPFDPEKHDALLHSEDEAHGPNIVIDVHKKGYYFKDRVIRHAQVIVSK
jgi:molecular chaperone GrpE